VNRVVDLKGIQMCNETLKVMLKRAEKIANKSPCNIKVSCIIFDDKNRIISEGYNHESNHSKRYGLKSIHAEIDALTKGVKRTNNLKALVYREHRRPINPCPVCEQLLKSFGITKIYCTFGDDRFLIINKF